MLPFHHIPSKVAASRNDVDLLVRVLPYVANEQPLLLGIKRKAPRVAKAVRPDLRLLSRLPDKRIIGRYALGRA